MTVSTSELKKNLKKKDQDKKVQKVFFHREHDLFQFLEDVAPLILELQNSELQKWISLLDEEWNLFKDNETSPVAHDIAITITMTRMTENLYQKLKDNKIGEQNIRYIF